MSTVIRSTALFDAAYATSPGSVIRLEMWTMRPPPAAIKRGAASTLVT
jgi:hypothetical protein